LSIGVCDVSALEEAEGESLGVPPHAKPKTAQAKPRKKSSFRIFRTHEGKEDRAPGAVLSTENDT
jgi:hypothetical protein